MKLNISKRLMLLLFLFGAGFLLIFAFGKKPAQQTLGATDAIYTIFVKGGYKPNVIQIPSGKAATLRLVTDNTYDCSAALSMPDIGINLTLPPTGNTDIPLPPQEKGKVITGGCTSAIDVFKIEYL